jgi:dTDP-4-amino-4,6-dideoxygalactose transaminase
MDKVSKIWLSPPHMSGYEKVFVQEAFESNWIAPVGKNITVFEEQLAALSGMNVLAVNSGTSAMHLALLSLDIQPGDHIFCQSLTFAGCAFPIQYQRAIPVFIDSEPESWNMDPDLLEEALKKYVAAGKKPKAIIVVHIYGMPASLTRIVNLARLYDVTLIEDAAEAVGSFYDSKPVGSFGDSSIYSFNGNKIITTSGGGALLTKDENHLKYARKLSDQAKENVAHYEHLSIGYNYRISNVCAGIGRGQMLVLEDRVKRKREIFDLYKGLFNSYSLIRFQQENSPAVSNRWLTVICFGSSANEQSF